MSETLGALFRSLQGAGLAMDAGQAMDALWLALRMAERGIGNEATPNDTGSAAPHPVTAGPDVARPERPPAPPPASPGPAPSPPPSPPRFAMLDEEVDGLDAVAGRWLTLERTQALAIGRELARALRPLRRRVRGPGRGTLDVDATVRRVLDEFVFLPSFMAARERWLDVLLVCDHGLSMIVWKETLDAFERVLRTSGAFRSVRSLWLESDAEQPALSARSGWTPVRDALQLPTMAHARARTVVLVVTDCVSPRWHDGSIPALLAAWGDLVPVSLLQVTPDWYWPRTALGDAAQGPLYGAGELPRNTRLSWRSGDMGLDGLLPGDAGPFAPIPLAAMTAKDVGRLASLLAGSGDGEVRGALFDLTWRGEFAGAGAQTPQSRVARFHALATEGARRLAAAFASSPVQTLGMLRLLRRDLLPGSQPFVEAEVLLGGLLQVRKEDASWEAGAALRLEFVDGVRALLQDSATVPDILRVLRHASREANAGSRGTFAAWLSEPEARESGLEALGEEFAAQAAPVLRRLGGTYARGVQSVASPTIGTREAKAPDVAVSADGEVSAEDPAGAPPVEPERTRKSAGPDESTAALIMRARAMEPATRFVGREREIEWLLERTRSGRGNSVRIVWVTGDEGVGKSALVAELVRTWNARVAPDQAFYWSFAKHASVDWWIRTLTDTASRSSSGSDADRTELRAALLGALAQTSRSLLVIDAVDRLAEEEWESLRDTLSLLARTFDSRLSIVVASRTPTGEGLSVTPLQLAPLPRDAVQELIQRTVEDPRFGNSSPTTDRTRGEALEASDLLAALSGGNPAVLLSLMELLAMGITAEEVHEQFVGRDGIAASISASAFRLAKPPFYDIREVRGLLESADAFVSEGKPTEALGEAERALVIAEQIGSGRPAGGELIARALESMGKINVRMGNRAEGVRQLQRALRAATDAGSAALAESLRVFLDDRELPAQDPPAQTVFHVYGRVSGVFFRTWVQQRARELQIEANAENLADGRIRVTALGAQSRVDALEQRLRVGPPGATVARVSREGSNIANTGADVFLSYASADREVALRVGEWLTSHGISVFADRTSLQPGEVWRDTLDTAVDRAGCVVVLLSSAALASDWVRREYTRGLERQVLVPALLEPLTPVPEELSSLSVVDLTARGGASESPAFDSLFPSIVRVLAGEGASEIGEPVESARSTPSDATQTLDPARVDLLDLDGPAWVQIAAGTFRMGSSDGAERERPEHTVGLSAYRISRYPITNRQYERFLEETGITAPAHWRGGRFPSGTHDHPITNISWHDASAFCDWLSSQFGLTRGGSVQLPTEAQWEFAARGTEGRRYPWGEGEPNKDHANFGRRGGGTMPVNAHPAGATPSGIWDMAGNAWEWCRDWFGPYPSEAVEDPVGAERGQQRVIRGGSHHSEPQKLRAAYRADHAPADVFDRTGFRVVWTSVARPQPTRSRSAAGRKRR